MGILPGIESPFILIHDIKMPVQLTPDFVRAAISTRHPNSRTCEEFASKKCQSKNFGRLGGDRT